MIPPRRPARRISALKASAEYATRSKRACAGGSSHSEAMADPRSHVELARRVTAEAVGTAPGHQGRFWHHFA